MSFKTFINKLWKGIENTWKKLVPEVKEKAELASEILDKIKAGASYLEMIEGLNPELVEKIQTILRVTLVKAGTVKDYIDGMDEDSILNSIRAGIDEATANGDIHRNVFLNGVSILITDAFADLVFLPKFVFSFIKKERA